MNIVGVVFISDYQLTGTEYSRLEV